MSNQLRITEIFYSLQGESRTVGLPTVFVRLTGCPLRCVYCDTAYAFTGGQWMDVEAVVAEVDKLNTSYVTVTGGEPLAQTECHQLLRLLADKGYKVSLETSGSIDISKVDKRIVIVMDVKTPASGEEEKNHLDNISYLKTDDQVKFVISNKADYDWSKAFITQYQLDNKCEILFSPVYGEIEPAELAQWIIEDHLPVRFQIQLHKLLWGEAEGK